MEKASEFSHELFQKLRSRGKHKYMNRFSAGLLYLQNIFMDYLGNHYHNLVKEARITIPILQMGRAITMSFWLA